MKKEHCKLSIKAIKNNPKNPKKHKDELIEESIKDIGYIDDIVVDENNIILAGHGRLNALRNLEYEEVDVIRVTGLTPEQKEKYMLLSNRSVEAGGWDYDALLKNFSNDILKISGFDDKILFSLEREQLEEEEIEIRPYKKTHILFSFKPEKMFLIQKYIEEIIKIEGVEYEQSSN